MEPSFPIHRRNSRKPIQPRVSLAGRNSSFVGGNQPRSSRLGEIGCRSALTPHTSVSQERKRWESVHICPNCGHVINLAEIDLKAVTTGIASCPFCKLVSRIEIQFIN